MTTADIPREQTNIGPVRTASGLVDRALARAGDWLNPILVKEARQAMKSRQFSITFTLLLTFGVIWSFLGISMQMPDVYYVPGGPTLLVGYCYILIVPMMIVIPFAAYRSLAAEREDGTYELLSITSLNAGRIVWGKLTSIALQMLVYYSAIGPCVAFTYLLRGVDVFTIGFVLIVTLMNSFILGLLGLFLASLTKGRHWQLMISVVLILACGFIAFWWGAMVTELIIESAMLMDMSGEFWLATWAFLLAYISNFAVLFVATQALNEFPSENRSTRIRVAVMVQLALFFGWIWYFFTLERQQEEFVLLWALYSAFYWMIYGALMTGESDQLSPRVLRQLPATFVGRLATAWFWPGPRTGYVFATTVFGAFLLAVIAADRILNWGDPARTDQVPIWSGLLWGYMATYLAIGLVMVRQLRRFVPHGFVLPLVVHLLIVLAGVAIPTFGEALAREFRNLDAYSAWQATNWWWTFQEAFADNSVVRGEVTPFVLFAGAVSYVLVLASSGRDVLQTRRAMPRRVMEDERQGANRS